MDHGGGSSLIFFVLFKQEPQVHTQKRFGLDAVFLALALEFGMQMVVL